MSRIKQSISWWCFVRGDFTPEKLVKTAVEIGYDAIELVGEEHWPLIRDNGLVIASTGGHQSLTDGLNKPGNHDRIEKEIMENLEKAVKWGVPNLICFSGNRNGMDDWTGAINTAKGLRRVAKAAEDAGVNLVVELLNSKVDHRDYQCDRTLWGVAVCEMVGSPRVRLLYDIYHMQIMEGDIIRTIRNYGGYFGHYHTAGNPGRNDMDETQEMCYPPIMKAILAGGYDGYVGHEFIPKGNPVAALKTAYEMCNVSL
jgi:hydroxypyruvate isomerase